MKNQATTLTCFKSYDIRGIVPEQINPDIAYDIGRAFADVIDCAEVVVGNDIRLSGPAIKTGLCNGLLDAGVNVIDIGLCGTEEVYFAVQHLNSSAGICVTASHNPANYNGMKFVGKGASPIAADNGLLEIKSLAERKEYKDKTARGELTLQDCRPDYVTKLLSFVNMNSLKPLKIVCNPGNGGAGLVIDAIENQLPFEFIKVQHEPDGHFPNGVPNPLLPENRSVTSYAVKQHKADMGIAWDGDFDRCFFFDESGNFIEGYYLVGLLAESLLAKNHNEKIVYDPRLYWNTLDVVEQAGGTPIKTPTGHAFVKQTMRKVNAIYGGEMSAHHYFRDFGYCDNGNIPWLLIAQLISQTGKTLSELIALRAAAFPCSGEINLTVNGADHVMTELKQHYQVNSHSVDLTDGIGIEFENWRFNVRKSNTEPLLRVNLETKADKALLETKTAELLSIIATLTPSLK